jgi:hypothetical protein
LREAIADVDARRRVLVVGFEPTEPIPLATAALLFRRLASVADHGPRLQDLAFGSNDRTAEGALQVFEAANRALAAFGPLVLAIDDLQWADEGDGCYAADASPLSEADDVNPAID